MKLQHVLSRAQETEVDLNRFRADELQKAARFWVGKEANRFNKQKSFKALAQFFNRKTMAKQVTPHLSDRQKQVLAIFARYGPVVSGKILQVELEQRGLEEKTDNSKPSYYSQRSNKVVYDLRGKLVLLGGGRDYYYHSYHRRYPELTMHPAIADAIAPAEPLSWQPSESSPGAKPLFVRSSAEPALDLWRVSEALRELGDCKGRRLNEGKSE